jgi:hypothetical protein
MQSPLAGLSLIEEDGGRIIFRWPAIAAIRHAAGQNSRSSARVSRRRPARCSFSLVGTTLFLMKDLVIEALLQPFFVGGRPIGTSGDGS